MKTLKKIGSYVHYGAAVVGYELVEGVDIIGDFVLTTAEYGCLMVKTAWKTFKAHDADRMNTPAATYYQYKSIHNTITDVAEKLAESDGPRPEYIPVIVSGKAQIFTKGTKPYTFNLRSDDSPNDIVVVLLDKRLPLPKDGAQVSIAGDAYYTVHTSSGLNLLYINNGFYVDD